MSSRFQPGFVPQLLTYKSEERTHFQVFTYWNAEETVGRLVREGVIEPLIVMTR